MNLSRANGATHPAIGWMLLFISITLPHSLNASNSAAGRHTLPGHVPAATRNLQPTTRLPATTHLNLAIGLPLRNQQALSSLLHDLYDPASPSYHQFLTSQQFAQMFGPTEE